MNEKRKAAYNDPKGKCREGIKRILRGPWLNTGSWIALALSWSINKSIWWGIFHLILSWPYVVYWGFKYSRLEEFVVGLMK